MVSVTASADAAEIDVDGDPGDEDDRGPRDMRRDRDLARRFR